MLAISVFGFSALAHAQAETTLTSPAKNTLEAQLVLAPPVGLSQGMTAGVGAGYTRRATPGGLLAWGARASWGTATEFPQYNSDRFDDIRMRVFAMLQHGAGRGSFGLRLGLGATLEAETLTVAQSSRLGSPITNTNWFLFPAADLEAVVVLRVWENWGMTVNGGPSLHLIDSRASFSWSSGLGVVWQH
ncbi:MAG TPA: hypothetical protein VF518_06495 [Polyangia bacterium]